MKINPGYEPEATSRLTRDAAPCLDRSTSSYDVALAVRISRDPIAEDGGLNLYGYVGNDPLNLTDPLGLAFGDYWDVRASAAFYRHVANTSENPWAAAAAALANATFTFWGVEALQENAERSGEAAGRGCPGQALGYGSLAAGQILLASGLADVAFVGREFSIGENLRIAPLGNRTTNELGTLPHYHRRIVGPAGETIPGGSMRWHRPWEKGF